MYFFKNFGFTRYESILGAGILAIGILVFLPSIKLSISRIMDNETQATGEQEAEIFARSIRQFHDETGKWPAFSHQGFSPKALLGSLLNGTSNESVEDGLFDAKPMPLDPWDNPFLVRYIESERDDPEEAKSIIVLSKGPNGKLETELSDQWYQEIGRRLINPGNEQSHLQGDPFGGDDVGFVLSRLDIGGSN